MSPPCDVSIEAACVVQRKVAGESGRECWRMLDPHKSECAPNIFDDSKRSLWIGRAILAMDASSARAVIAGRIGMCDGNTSAQAKAII